MNVDAKLKFPKMTRDEALRFFQDILEKNTKSRGWTTIVAWLRSMPMEAKVRVTKDLITGGVEVKRINWK